MLRSYDLIWSKMTQDDLHGKDRSMVDLLAWNADTTRKEEHVVAENIHVQVFVVSTEMDRVAVGV